jgi:signal transduction histidine kinase
VLDNLLRNAIFASPPAGAVEVEIGSGPRLRVLDRGTGIPASLRPRLYEPFASGRPDGTGLGLAVCARIVRAYGGSLSHEDRAGGGTIAIWSLEK